MLRVIAILVLLEHHVFLQLESNGWREGTGKLELLLRDNKGELHWRPVTAGEVKDGPVCWSQSPPEQPLPYYRLVSNTAP